MARFSIFAFSLYLAIVCTNAYSFPERILPRTGPGISFVPSFRLKSNDRIWFGQREGQNDRILEKMSTTVPSSISARPIQNCAVTIEVDPKIPEERLTHHPINLSCSTNCTDVFLNWTHTGLYNGKDIVYNNYYSKHNEVSSKLKLTPNTENAENWTCNVYSKSRQHMINSTSIELTVYNPIEIADLSFTYEKDGTVKLRCDVKTKYKSTFITWYIRNEEGSTLFPVEEHTRTQIMKNHRVSYLLSKNLHAKVYVCEAKSGLQKVHKEISIHKAELGKPCITRFDCTARNSVCLNGTCQCDGLNPVKLSYPNEEQCLSVSELGERCSYSVQCQSYDVNSRCNQGRCICVNQFKEENGRCWRQLSLGEYCEETNECLRFISNSECITSSWGTECGCKEGFYPKSEIKCIPLPDTNLITIFLAVAVTGFVFSLFTVILLGAYCARRMYLQRKTVQYKKLVASKA